MNLILKQTNLVFKTQMEFGHRPNSKEQTEQDIEIAED